MMMMIFNDCVFILVSLISNIKLYAHMQYIHTFGNILSYITYMHAIIRTSIYTYNMCHISIINIVEHTCIIYIHTHIYWIGVILGTPGAGKGLDDVAMIDVLHALGD